MMEIRSLLRVIFAGNMWRLLVLSGTIYLVALYSLVMPLLFAVAIDIVLPQGLRTHLIMVVVTALLLALLRFCLAFMQDYEFQRLRLRSETAIVHRVLRRAIARPGDVPTRGGGAGIDSWLRLWLVNFQYQFTDILFFAAYALLISVTVLVVIFWIDVGAGTIVALFAGLHYANFRYHNAKSRQHSYHYSAAKALLVSDVAAAIRSKRAINVAQLDDRIAASLHGRAAETFAAGRERSLASASQGAVQSVLRGLLFLLLVAYCAPRIADAQLTAGNMFFLLLLVSFAYEPVYRLNQVTVAFNQMLANFAPLRSFAEPLDCRQGGGDVGKPDEAIQIVGVSRDIDGIALFPPLTATLLPGQVHVLCGPSGCGKSSLLDLISGLDSPSAGQIRWGKSDMQKGAASIFVSGQKALIFEASLAANVTLFEAAPDRARVSGLLQELGLDQLASDLDMIVAPDRLSLGERQRIALARALYQPTKLLLLLDEPTANLDRKTETMCLDAIARHKAGRITLLVSHSDQAGSIADTTITMESAYGNR